MSRLEVIRPHHKPSLWDRIRSYTLGPLTLKDPALRKYFGTSETSTGVPVDERKALTYSAVWSAVNLIAGDVAALPLVLYKRDGNGKIRYDAHPLYRVLHDQPNPEMTSYTFRQTLQAHVLTWGNGYAEIERDTLGRARYLWPLTPDRVTPTRDNGRLQYRVSNQSVADTVLDASDVLHIPGLGWDGDKGYSPIALARESVGLGLAAERFGASFYGNGSTFGGTITHPTKFATQLARENFEESLRNRHKGVNRAHGLLLLEEGMTYAQIGIPPEQAQFLESRQFQITEIARWFNVPPHKIGDLSRATFSNIEQQNIEYFQTTLIHWLETWEQELMRKLISPLERNQQYIEHVVEGLLRGDSQGRAALETAEFRIAGIVPNEVRALSNRNPVEGGDEAFVSMDVMPLSKAAAYWDAQIEALKAKTQPPPDGGARSAELAAEVRTLGASVESVAAQLSESRAAYAELLKDSITATQTAEREREAKDAAERRGSELESRIEALTEQLAVNASLLQDAEDRQALSEGCRRDVEDELADVVAARNEAAAARDAAESRAAALDAKVSELAAALGDVAKERDEARHAEAHIAELLDGAQTALAAEQAERAQEAERLTAERDEAKGAVVTWTADWEEEHRKCEAASAVVVDLTTQLSDRDALLAQRDAELAAAREAQREAVDAEVAARAAQSDAEQRAEQAERDRAIAESAQAAANAALDARRQAEATRAAAVTTAHRALLVDTMRRLLTKETDRARRHQGTPQKLRAWSETFYPDHVETVAAALRPVLIAEMAWRQQPGDADAIARGIADAHCLESQEQIRLALAVEDVSGPLERMLQRWEATRPEMVADRVMQEGVAHVRSL